MGALDLIYSIVIFWSISKVTVESALVLTATGFAMLVIVTDWGRVRQLRVRHATTPGAAGLLVGFVAVTLALWIAAMTTGPDQLAVFFAFFAALFFVQAVRDIVLEGLSLVELVLRGQATLVVVCAVFWAVAGSIGEFGIVLVWVAILVFVAQRLYYIVGRVLQRYVIDDWS